MFIVGEHHGYGNASSIHRNPHHHSAAQSPVRSQVGARPGRPSAHPIAIDSTTWLPSCLLDRDRHHHLTAQSPIRTHSGAQPARPVADPMAIRSTPSLPRCLSNRHRHHHFSVQALLPPWKDVALQMAMRSIADLPDGPERIAKWLRIVGRLPAKSGETE